MPNTQWTIAIARMNSGDQNASNTAVTDALESVSRTTLKSFSVEGEAFIPAAGRGRCIASNRTTLRR